jgi:quercetin dioxygenase-like cupin family protein
MKINRWTAEISPNFKIIENLFKSEGLDFKTIHVASGAKMSNQRAPMGELIQIVDGELIFNLSGNQFSLRAGDRLELAANTMYSYSNLKPDESTFLTAYKL